MEDRGHRRESGLSRRELIKRTLKTGAYAAPVILSATVPMVSVSAVTPGPGTPIQDAVLVRVGHNATFDVLYVLNGTGTPALLGQIVSDNLGVAGGVFGFPGSVNLRGVTTVTLTYFLNVGGVRSPVAAAPPFTSGLVGLMNGSTRQFVGVVVQAPAAGCPAPTSYTEYIDVAIVNGPPNTAYDFYVQPNTAGAPLLVTSRTTSAQGHVTVFAPSAPIASAVAPTSVTVIAVLAGQSPAAPAFTLTATAGAGTLTALSCVDVSSTSGTSVGIAKQ